MMFMILKRSDAAHWTLSVCQFNTEIFERIMFNAYYIYNLLDLPFTPQAQEIDKACLETRGLTLT